jgi:omega-6 fatty acid desaturase (delta-12 desaturase)
MAQNEQIDEAIRRLLPFSQKNEKKATLQISGTFIALISSLVISYFFYTFFRPGLFISIPSTVVFMCRSYVVLHDCGHGSFFKSDTLNKFVGNIFGFFILIPFGMWRFIHNSHHLHVGNLDKRNLNPEVWTLTINEYRKTSSFKKIAYRFMRSKFTRFVIAPTINFLLIFRLLHPEFNRTAKFSVIIHDIVYVGLVFLSWKLSLLSMLILIFLFPLILFYSIAAFTFYTQHQFEDTYWEGDENWDYKTASFYGANSLDAPSWFKWLTGNVVYHNAHHLVPTIPNFKLEEAQNALTSIIPFKLTQFNDVFKLFSQKIWDERTRKLVSFQDAFIDPITDLDTSGISVESARFLNANSSDTNRA